MTLRHLASEFSAAASSLLDTGFGLLIHAASGRAGGNVNGGKMLKPSDAVGGWLELAEVECGVYRVVMPYLMGMAGAQRPQVLLGITKLANYVGTCAGTQ